MKHRKGLLGLFIAVVVIGLFIFPHRAPAGEASVNVIFDCNSSGGVVDCERTASFGGLGQVYLAHYDHVRNDEPPVKVYVCINNTGGMWIGYCATVQDHFQINNPIDVVTISPDDPAQYRFMVIHGRAHGGVFNDNNFTGEFTMHRRFVEITSFTPLSQTIPSGSPAVVSWDAEYTIDRTLLVSHPGGGTTSEAVPESASSYQVDLQDTDLGVYTLTLRFSGPSEDDGLTYVEESVMVTVGSSSSSAPRYACENNACIASSTGPYATSTCDNECVVGGGRYKCTGAGAECAWDPNDSGPNQCSPPSDSACLGSGPHTECQGNACVSVPGPGSNQCSSNAECASPTHRACSALSCVVVPGGGANQCNTNSDCRHNICSANGSCVPVSGPGSNQCATSGDCPQPPPSCTFSASPSRVVVPPPRSSTLTWVCSNAASCSINHGVGSVSPTGGSTNVSVSQDITYTLNCSGSGGSNSFTTTVRAFEWTGGKLREIVP